MLLRRRQGQQSQRRGRKQTVSKCPLSRPFSADEGHQACRGTGLPRWVSFAGARRQVSQAACLRVLCCSRRRRRSPLPKIRRLQRCRARSTRPSAAGLARRRSAVLVPSSNARLPPTAPGFRARAARITAPARPRARASAACETRSTPLPHSVARTCRPRVAAAASTPRLPGSAALAALPPSARSCTAARKRATPCAPPKLSAKIQVLRSA